MRPFDRQLSAYLDAVIILLEAPLPLWVRLMLRYLKRRFEQRIGS